MQEPSQPAQVTTAWPLLLTTEMAALFLSVDKGTFSSMVSRMKVSPVEVGPSEFRWQRRDLERAAAKLPKLEVDLGLAAMPSSIVLDNASIDRIAVALAARLGSPSRSHIPEVVSLKEACVALGIGRSTIYRLINLDKIDVKKIGRRTLVPRAEIERIQAVGIEYE